MEIERERGAKMLNFVKKLNFLKNSIIEHLMNAFDFKLFLYKT
jgi:hypothetical protein